MRFRSLISAVGLGLASLSLGACATGLDTRVTRYQPAAIPAGASFYVVPREGSPSPQFYRYASMLAQQLQTYGYQPAGSPQAADMLVRVAYGVDEGQTVVQADPFYDRGYGYGFGGYGYRDPWFDPFWGVYHGRPYYSPWSSSPFYYGWNDPFYYGRGYNRFGYGGMRGYQSYTVYKSHLDMDIVQRGSDAPLFEGHAQAKSESDNLDGLVPNLIRAMFTGFPGRNGETVKITIPAAQRS